MEQVCLNGLFKNVDDPVFLSSNRGFRYGDGLFETMRVHGGKIPLASFHFERLFHGLKTLEIDAEHLSAGDLIQLITELVFRNGHQKSARARLAVYRNEQNKAAFLIETANLDLPIQLNKYGLSVAIYTGAKRQCDVFSNLKTANYLPYVMAERFAKRIGVNEAILLNMQGYVSDGSKTNLFILREGIIYTPGLDQGCVAGVMRRYVIEFLKQQGMNVIEGPVSVSDLSQANELFLTNAIRGIQWVAQFEQAKYERKLTTEIYQAIWPTILR